MKSGKGGDWGKRNLYRGRTDVLGEKKKSVKRRV